MFKKGPKNKKKLKCKTKKQANDSFCDSIIYPEKDMVDILRQKENLNKENLNKENLNEENLNKEKLNEENLNEENCFLKKRTDENDNKQIINSNKYIKNELDNILLSPNEIYEKKNIQINDKPILESSNNINVMDISENTDSIYGQNNNNDNNYVEPIKYEKKEYEICNSNSSVLKSASDSNIDEQTNKNNDNYKKELSIILNNEEIIAYLKLNNKKDIDEKTNYLFPSIDIDHKSYSYLEQGQDDYLIEMDKKIDKEIENFQNTFNHFYNLDNTNNKFDYNNDDNNNNDENNDNNNNNNYNNNNNDNNNNNYINEQNKEEITKNLNNNNILNTNENNVPNNMLVEKINDTYIGPKRQNKNHIFTYKLKKNIYGKIQKQKKCSHSTTKTRHYTLLNNLFNINKKNILDDKKLQKHLRRKKKEKYYIFPYNCGNTQIQLITGYIRCFKKYSLYKEFKKHEIRKNQKLNNEEVKKLNHINNMQNEFEISLLLCVNVSNCISPSEFLEHFYPYDNFIFFLKVLNTKSNEEYMIYFLTFHIYVKQIMKRSRTLTFFNMKKKKNVKLYLVKDITMNRISCINKKKKKKKFIINTDTFFEYNEKKRNNRIEDSSLAYYHMRTKLYEIQKKAFINPLYIISQNKFQLSCAVCLEPLYSENLSKIISYIFHNHFEKNKNITGIKKKKDADNIITIDKDKNVPSNLKFKYMYGKRDTTNFNNKENFNDSLTFEKQYEDNKESFKNIPSDDILNKEIPCKEELEYNKEFKDFNKKKYNYYLHVIRYISSIQNKYDSEIKNKWKKKQNNVDTIYDNNKVYNNVCINILCGHIFHSNCLKKCCFTSCPICRYKQYNYQIANCDICEKNKNVKICLFCCFIGCSINYEEQSKIKEKKLKEKHKFIKRKLYLVKRILYMFIRIVYPFLQTCHKIYLHGKCNMIQQLEKKKNKYIKNIEIEMNDIRYNTLKANNNKVEQFPEIQSIKEEDKNRDKNVNKNIYEHMGSRKNKHRYSMNKFYKYIYIRNIKDRLQQNYIVYNFKSNKIGIMNKVHFNISSYKKKKKIKKINTCNLYSVVLNNSTECTLLTYEKKKKEKKKKKKKKSDKKNNKNKKYIKGYRKNNIDHAIEHFYHTNHNYFYDISKNSVYDYSSQLYTKTIINFKKEDKENLNDMYSVNVTNHNDEKEIIDKKNIIMYIYEYNQLLCALLESQRNNFLESISDMKKNYENISKDNFNEANKIFKQLKTLQQKNENLKNDIKKKISTLHEKNINNENLKKELQNLELINKKLSDDQKKEINNYEMKAEEKKKIIKEKQQIIRELKQQVNKK
ncbi:hypothetical protein PFBG_01103 [Plasmodium falciparum 7G8]|uniref:RING-type domain-containing protein n=1 Tax=Plasmodium falciparum (isolate 7G8) TaxID=57266 RepID=W7FJP8_PLAF8|nr:hypothetical protein PFBG_01103 [Plasmodium falciparum 7G8]